MGHLIPRVYALQKWNYIINQTINLILTLMIFSIKKTKPDNISHYFTDTKNEKKGLRTTKNKTIASTINHLNIYNHTFSNL